MAGRTKPFGIKGAGMMPAPWYHSGPVRRLALGLLAVAAVLVLAACGNKPKISTVGETEGTYLNVGPLSYQVQISRQLNPDDIEDRTYLQGLPPFQAKLATGQTWFGVFLRVANESKKPHPAANAFTIVDTQDDRYFPVKQSPQNAFTYQGGIVPASGLLAPLDSVASEGVIQGSLVLFKLPLSALDNRPLEFIVTDQLQNKGRVSLDV
jgi:hypothetical protein